MSATFKKVFTVVLSVVFAAALLLPVISFAESDEVSNGTNNTEIDSGLVQDPNQSEDGAVTPDVITPDAIPPDAVPPEEDPSDNCVATIKYYENVIYEEPGIPADSNGRYLLGTRTLTGLKEGTVLNAWNYVIDLPGYFFFDGWPGSLTVSTDPDQNVLELFYFRYSNYSYSVNYYVLTGADLSADTWDEALKPDSVEFIKIGSEVFENHPYGELVKGDTFEYPIDGLYAVDAYPSEIRVGVDGSDDAINILYVSKNATLPDDVEIPEVPPVTDKPTTPEFPSTPDKPTTPNKPTLPSTPTVPSPPLLPDAPVLPDGPTLPDVPTLPDTPTLPDDSVIPDNPSNTPNLPEGPADPDEPEMPPLENGSGTSSPDSSLIGPILPNGGASIGNGTKLPTANDSSDSKDSGNFKEVDTLFKDYIDSERESGAIEITDDMLENPVDPAMAQDIIDAYNTGYKNGTESAGAQNAFNLTDHIICIILIIIFAVLTVIGFALYGRERNKLQQLKNEEDMPTNVGSKG